jgi:hypothetical protein
MADDRAPDTFEPTARASDGASDPQNETTSDPVDAAPSTLENPRRDSVDPKSESTNESRSSRAPEIDARGSFGSDPSTTGWIAALLIAASLVMVLWNLQDSSLENANTGSRYATIESLVDYGTYTIDQSQYVRTIDKVKVGKHYISTKPPTLPTYAAGVYWMFQKLTGKTLAANEGACVWFISLCTGWLAHLVFLVYLWRLSRLLLQRQLAILGLMAAGCFSYLGVAYATAINNHSIGAAIALVGFYYAYRLRNQIDVKPRHWVQAGLCFGFLTAVDLPSGALMVGALVYLGTYDWRKTLWLFAPALLPGLACQLALGYHITGSFKPAYENAELKQFAGNYFKGNQHGIDALREPKWLYTFNSLFGHHGVFSMTPLFCFGAWEMARALRSKRRWPEVILIVASSVVITAFYMYRTRNYGGWSVGMRHLLPIMPFLLVYFGVWLDRVKLTRTLGALMIAAFSISAFNVQDGLSSPFQFSLWHNWLESKPNRGRVGKKLNLSSGPKHRRPVVSVTPEG